MNIKELSKAQLTMGKYIKKFLKDNKMEEIAEMMEKWDISIDELTQYIHDNYEPHVKTIDSSNYRSTVYPN